MIRIGVPAALTIAVAALPASYADSVVRALATTRALVDDCLGCRAVEANTVELVNLTVEFPDITPGTCVECPACGECIADPCTITGDLVFTDNSPAGTTFLYRKFGEDGWTTISKSDGATIHFQAVDKECGDVEVYQFAWIYLGQQTQASGTVDVGCSACPE